MTFYDSFFPSYDYNPYQHPSYVRRQQPMRGMNPYASMYQQPSSVYDPYQRTAKQQPRHFAHQQQVRHPHGYPAFYQEEPEEEPEEQEFGEEEEEEIPSFQNYQPHQKSNKSRSPEREPMQRGRSVQESDGIHIPIRRAQPTQTKTQYLSQKQQRKQNHQQPQVNKPQSNSSKTPAKDGKKSTADADKVAVDRSVLEHKEEDPLIIELPIDQISSSPSTYDSDVSYQPGKVEYIWEDEDNDDVIETIIDSPIHELHSERLEILSPEKMILEEVQENVDEPPTNYTAEELEMWKKELETFSFIGFNDANILIPHLRELVQNPNIENEAKQRGLQEILRRLILH